MEYSEEDFVLPVSAFSELWDGIRVISEVELPKDFCQPTWVTIRTIEEWKQANKPQVVPQVQAAVR